jgi:Uma2 family endonuclease
MQEVGNRTPAAIDDFAHLEPGMSISPDLMTLQDYDLAAEEYRKSLPLEHFMESTPHATQREITVESMGLLKLQRPDLHYFNELLVQYPWAGRTRQVVPDNMLVLGDLAERDRTNFPVVLENSPPFMMLEYVSQTSKGKDYGDAYAKYENELRTPYCLFFDPLAQDLRIYRHDGEGYERLEPDLQGRIAVPELDLEIGIHDRWVRYWHRGAMLKVPAELMQEMQAQVHMLKRQAEQIDRQAEQIDRQAEQINDLTLLLRRQIERRAAAAGRQDILDQLPATRDAKRLESWLSELEGD